MSSMYSDEINIEYAVEPPTVVDWICCRTPDGCRLNTLVNPRWLSIDYSVEPPMFIDWIRWWTPDGWRLNTLSNPDGCRLSTLMNPRRLSIEYAVEQPTVVDWVRWWTPDGCRLFSPFCIIYSSPQICGLRPSSGLYDMWPPSVVWAVWYVASVRRLDSMICGLRPSSGQYDI